jgi:hypothetical protein
MVDFVPLGYVTLEQAIDEIGRHLMPAEWQGPEIILLKRDDRAIEELPAIGAAVASGTPIGRLSWAINYLVAGLFAGDVKAVVAREDRRLRDVPAALWIRPGMRAVFRTGELPVEFCVAIEGHKAGTGRRSVLLLGSDLRRLLRRMATTRGRPDVEVQFRAWLARKIDEFAGARPPRKKRIWVEAQGVFGPELPFHSFERIWTAMVPAAWRRQKRAGPAAAPG